jgi:hypothetical protein
MRSLLKLLAAVAVTALLGGVPLFAQDINVDYNHDFSFNQMKKFSWGKIQVSNTALEPRLVAAIDHVIEQYGFRQTDKDHKGDFIFTAVEANSPQQYAAFYGSLGFDWHRTWGGGGFSGTVASPHDIHPGTLVIDIYNGPTRKLIWRGIAAGNPAERDQTQASIDQTVNTMFAHYPPKSGGPLAPNEQEVPPSPSSQPAMVSPN